MTNPAIKNYTSFICMVVDLLEDDYEQSKYRKVFSRPSIVLQRDYILDVTLTDIEFPVGMVPRTRES